MSIIHEALKKTQGQLEIAKNSPHATEQKESGPGLKILVAFLTLGFLTSVIYFIIFILKASSPLPQIDNTARPSASEDIYKQKITDIFPKTASAKAGKEDIKAPLKLNGIVSMDNTYIALINNKVYREGDYIGNKRVLSISLDRVEIFEKGGGITTLENNN